MNTIKEKLYKGEIDGVEFFFKDLSESGGRKTVFHKFINSDVVKGQDLGADSNSFALDIYVAGIGRTIKEINEDYYQRKEAMLNVLNKFGNYSMVHPTRGLLNVMLDGKYKIRESVASLNKCNISASFVVVDNEVQRGNPFAFVKQEGELRVFDLASGGVTSSRVQENADDDLSTVSTANLRNSIFDRCGWTVNTLLQEFMIKADFFKSSQSILENVNSVVDLMEVSLQAISGTKDISDVFRQIESLKFLNTGSKLGQIGLEIGRVFVAVENSIEDSTLRYQFFKSFFEYNDNYKSKQVLTATSQTNIQTEQNEILFRNYIQGLGCAYACNALADYQYQNETELNEISTEIDAQLIKLLDFVNEDVVLYNYIQRQRILVIEQIEKSRLVVKRIINVNVVNSSLTNICYTFYESLDLFDDLQALNKFSNPSNINGTIKILSSGDI